MSAVSDISGLISNVVAGNVSAALPVHLEHFNQCNETAFNLIFLATLDQAHDGVHQIWPFLGKIFTCHCRQTRLELDFDVLLGNADEDMEDIVLESLSVGFGYRNARRGIGRLFGARRRPRSAPASRYPVLEVHCSCLSHRRGCLIRSNDLQDSRRHAFKTFELNIMASGCQSDAWLLACLVAAIDCDQKLAFLNSNSLAMRTLVLGEKLASKQATRVEASILTGLHAPMHGPVVLKSRETRWQTPDGRVGKEEWARQSWVQMTCDLSTRRNRAVAHPATWLRRLPIPHCLPGDR